MKLLCSGMKRQDLSLKPPVSESALFVCLSNILPGYKMSVLVLSVEMGPHSSNIFSPGINTGSLSSLAFSHSLLQSLQCSPPLWACGSSRWHWQEPLIIQGHTTSLGNLPTLISLLHAAQGRHRMISFS